MERIRFDHPNFKEFFESKLPFIYRPDDDSKNLVDAVEQIQPLIFDHVKPAICLEIGCGSGYVINSIAKSFGSMIVKYYATDINSVAIETTIASGKANGVTNVQVVKTNLVDDLKRVLQNRVDLLVTNPPFEPSPIDDVGKEGSICAWSAGPNGRTIIDRILVEFPDLMSEHGVALMCCCKENDVEDIRREMKKRGFYSKILIEGDGTTSSSYNRIYYQYVVAFSKTNYWKE
ncbi:Methyltransferase N6AMT1 [Pseudolycoriella hygida]|uniref:Methyltransferase N6AMT1 n=1 Tax=Pseudolycoriella hygida TaxID=35572 RepID=A0A9Q0N884_9DIPT|nr:Methyltransferase N6AMT1 [Pseudolycoriella hygida]